jgi:hypothetical protein
MTERNGMRRFLTVAMLSLTLVGCDALLTEPGPRLGEPLPDGSLVVGWGEVDGAVWVYTASRDQGSICLSLTFGTEQREPSCHRIAGIGVGSSSGASWDRGLTMADGVVNERVAQLRIRTAGGPMHVPVASLASLGIRGGAYGVVIREPAMSDVHDGILLDAAGSELDPVHLGPIEMLPIEQQP